MDEGLDPHCLELGDSPEHRLLTWAGRRANKDGLVLLGVDKVFYRANQEARAGEESFQHLEDGGWIEKVRVGESFRWKVLVPCTCGGEIRHPPLAAVASLNTMRFARRSEASHIGSGFSNPTPTGALSGVKSESAQKRETTLDLASHTFPQLVQEIKHPGEDNNSYALASHLKKWRRQYSISIDDIRLMMAEFVRHPEWYQRRRVPLWRCFVYRREELVSLTALNKHRDPSLAWQQEPQPVFVPQRDPSLYWQT